jgi:hypothetical protein
MPARALHSEWGLERPVGPRRLEDASACGVLGCKSAFLEFPDAIYRQDSGGQHLYPTFESLRAPAAREDQPLPQQLATEVHGYLREMDAVVFCPMAIGGHVDHVLTKDCGRLLERNNSCVLYYRDFSYDRAWDAHFDPLTYERVDVSLSREELARKVAAFSEYKSQISGLFGNQEGLLAYFEDIGRSESIFIPRRLPRANLRLPFHSVITFSLESAVRQAPAANGHVNCLMSARD